MTEPVAQAFMALGVLAILLGVLFEVTWPMWRALMGKLKW